MCCEEWGTGRVRREGVAACMPALLLFTWHSALRWHVKGAPLPHMKFGLPSHKPAPSCPFPSSPAGHQHTYYRSCPVFQEKCMQDGSGVTHFIIGTGGHELSGAAEEQKDWVAGSLNDWGFVRFDVSGSRMRARFVRSATGEVADEVQLYAQVDPSEDEACRAARKQG